MAKIKLDFTGVEEFVKCEEGKHLVKLVAIEPKESSNGNEMLEAKFEVIKGSSTGATLFNNFVLIEKALWRLKSYLSIVGIKADGRVALDLDKLIGKKCMVEVAHEEYNGNTYARITDFKKIEVEPDLEEDEDVDFDEEEEEEQPKPKKKKKEEPKKKPKKKPEPEEEEDDEDDDEDWED